MCYVSAVFMSLLVVANRETTAFVVYLDDSRRKPNLVVTNEKYKILFSCFTYYTLHFYVQLKIRARSKCRLIDRSSFQKIQRILGLYTREQSPGCTDSQAPSVASEIHSVSETRPRSGPRVLLKLTRSRRISIYLCSNTHMYLRI